MNYPRLLDDNGKIARIIYPLKVALDLTLVPASFASITLAKGEGLPARSYVELFSPYGSAGVFRVRSPHDSYGDEITTAELEHAISEVGDYLVKEEIKSMMESEAAVKKIFDHYKGKKWKLGTTSPLGKTKVAVEEAYSRVLDAMLAVLDQRPDIMMTFDFSSSPWKINFAKKDTTVSAEGRLSRNVTAAQITYDDSTLCTRAYYKTYKTSGNKVTESWTSKDADTLKTYGVVEREVVTSADMTADEITYTVDTYLKEHKNPRISVSIDAEDLTAITGESSDKFTLGKLMRLAIPEYKVTVEETITGTSWMDLYTASARMTVTLGEEEDTVVNFLHEIDSSGGSSSGKSVKKWQEYESTIDQQATYIDLNVKRIDKNSKILQEAGMDINSKGVLIYSTDNENNIASRIKTQADRISLVVEGTGKNAKIKPAEIVASINNGKSDIRISASHIRIGDKNSKTTLDSAITYASGQVRMKKNLYMDWENSKSKIYTSGGIEYVGATSAQGIKSYLLDYNTLGKMVKEASLDGSELLLKLFDGTEINFKKATSLTGVWSGTASNEAIYKVYVTGMQSLNKTIGFKGSGSTVDDPDVKLEVQTNGSGDVDEYNEKFVDAPLKVVELNGQAQPTTRFTFTRSIDATAVWNKGQTNGKKAATVTLSYGTVTTDSQYQKHLTFKATNNSNTSKKDEMEIYLVKSGSKAQLRKEKATGTVIMEINV